MTALELAASQWIFVVFAWGIWQLLPRRPPAEPRKGTLAAAMDGITGLRYVMSLAIGFVIADLLGALALHKPITVTDALGMIGLVCGAVAVLVGSKRTDHAKPSKG